MNFRIGPKRVTLFLAGLGFGVLGIFPETCYSDGPFPPTKPTPTPQYVVQMQTEYPADQTKPKKISAILIRGTKELWTHIEPYPMVNTIVIQDTGRSFLKLGDAHTVELRVYSKTGTILLDQKNVLPLAVSFGGNFIAYESPASEESGPVTTMVFDLKDKTSKRFNIGAGCRGIALSGNGKYLLVFNQGTGLSGSNYSLIDENGHKIWERNGNVSFLALGNKGNWLLWTDQGKNTIECSDFKTGKVVREFPAAIFKMLYRQFPEIRSF
jgi:hypothetical protein